LDVGSEARIGEKSVIGTLFADPQSGFSLIRFGIGRNDDDVMLVGLAANFPSVTLDDRIESGAITEQCLTTSAELHQIAPISGDNFEQ
jgi:hypothetical protein